MQDVVVVGAGIVGVSTALELVRAGRSVTLVDRRGPGEETSFGNAGVIERGVYVPIAMPLSLRGLMPYVGNTRPELHLSWADLPRLAPWLLQLARNSTEARLRENGAAVSTLLEHAVDEHKRLMSEAGCIGLLRETGWLRLYRTERSFETNRLDRDIADEVGAPYQLYTADEAVAELEPNLTPAFARAILWPEVASVSDPGAVTRAYAGLFERHGGRFEKADVRSLRRRGEAWVATTAAGEIAARAIVVATGPWAMDLLRPLGYRFPFAVKRGYHRHYRPQGNAMLNRPVLDGDNGYVMTPMTAGIRITTGIEFADRDAAANPVQIGRVEPLARELFALGEPVESEPWLGRRPCLPDTRPIIGAAPGRPGLWLNFGHAHLGFTLGPVSGRILAEMMSGAAPLVDASPFRADRF